VASCNIGGPPRLRFPDLDVGGQARIEALQSASKRCRDILIGRGGPKNIPCVG